MVTIDRRSRFATDDALLTADAFVDESAVQWIDERRHEAGRAANELGLAPLSMEIEGQELTIDIVEERLTVRRGADDGLLVALDQDAFSDLMQDKLSTFGAQMLGRARVQRGNADSFLAWEPLLRCVLDDRPVYAHGSITFEDRTGAALDLHQSFTLDSDPADVGHFLAEAGYLHFDGVFTTDEMDAVSAELDDAIAVAKPDDGASWWARTSAGESYPSRILGFNHGSPTLRGLLRSDRFRSLATFTDDRYTYPDPDDLDCAEGLLKKIGVVEGMSDVSWHKDCSMGGHSRGCCSLTIGISVTGAGAENGELGVVAGSHRANVPVLGVAGLDLPRVPLPTRTGDVTVHCSCTLHMSRPPVSAERRVVYSGLSLAPRAGDREVKIDAAAIRRQRAGLADHSGRLRGTLTDQSASFEL